MKSLNQWKASAAVFALTALSTLSLSASASTGINNTRTLAQGMGQPLNVCRQIDMPEQSSWATEMLSLRTGPSFSADIIAPMYDDEEVVLMYRGVEGLDGDIWHEVIDSAGNRGYIPAALNGMSTLGTCSYPAQW